MAVVKEFDIEELDESKNVELTDEQLETGSKGQLTETDETSSTRWHPSVLPSATT
jgi:hypothetical protein